MIAISLGILAICGIFIAFSVIEISSEVGHINERLDRAEKEARYGKG